MIVAHWPDGAETVIPQGDTVAFDASGARVLDSFADAIAGFPPGLKFSYRPAATRPIFEEPEEALGAIGDDVQALTSLAGSLS